MDVHDRAWWKLPIINRRSWTWRDANKVVRAGEWYQNAVIYQIAPWSFQDSNGDGKGDLQGIIRRLDYIASLGVDAVWLTPVYPSPMDDLGYDISDMCAVGESFGTMGDLQRLLELLHLRGLKLILDMVWSHTSERHPWFEQSRRSRDDPKADWYVWADPSPDGGPPNNWLSMVTGGSGWKFDERRGQYYFFNFFPSQPDLNWNNPEVRAEILGIARFWLEQGIDGMRLDAVNFYCHDPALRDNPPRTAADGKPDGIDINNPAAAQLFRNSFGRPESYEALRPLRALVDEYPGVVLLGEVTLAEDSVQEAANFARGRQRLHLSYHSALLFEDRICAQRMRAVIEKVIAAYGEGGACWIMGNHDYGRMRSLWGGMAQEDPEAFYRMMIAVLLSLPGALCLWQGDELGLPEARIPDDLPVEDLRDPMGRLLYPRLTGRDPSRTPMPWDDAEHACGFTTAAQPWLPLPDSHRARSVARQAADPQSFLNAWRRLLHWRVRQPALEGGSLELSDLPPPLLALVREYNEQRLLCLFNFSDGPVSTDLSSFSQLVPARGLGNDFDWDAQTRQLRLPAWGAFFADLRTLQGVHHRSQVP
jgi:alpha-glucosidase